MSEQVSEIDQLNKTVRDQRKTIGTLNEDIRKLKNQLEIEHQRVAYIRKKLREVSKI